MSNYLTAQITIFLIICLVLFFYAEKFASTRFNFVSRNKIVNHCRFGAAFHSTGFMTDIEIGAELPILSCQYDLNFVLSQILTYFQ